MKILRNKLEKEEIKDMPQVSFSGRIITIYTEGEAERAVDFLLSQPILGIDTETRPSFQKGKIHKVGLVQISTHDTCFLFRLNFFGLTPALIRLLEDRNVPKVGLSLKDDIASLKKRKDFKPIYLACGFPRHSVSRIGKLIYCPMHRIVMQLPMLGHVFRFMRNLKD